MSVYLMTVILDTCRAHKIRYLRFDLFLRSLDIYVLFWMSVYLMAVIPDTRRAH
jgi:hypothetical protein